MRTYIDEIVEFLVRETPLEAEEAAGLIETPADPSRGDVAVPCFKLAKALKKSPAAIAADLSAAFSPGEFVRSVEAAGPYLNFRLERAPWYAAVLEAPAAPCDEGAGKTIVLDYGSPNISKHLAYHHLRSLSIGFSLKRIFDHLGYRTVGVNHLGDWGTTHGKLLAAWKRWGEGTDLSEDGVTKLNALYVRYSAEGDAEEAREWFRKLEEGDAEARSLWERFREVSLAEFAEVFERIGVTFDEVRGESSFVEASEVVIEMVREAGLAEISDGALVVRLDDPETPPFFLRKADGATVYSTRDLAAILKRWNDFGFERCLYVVDMGQSLHFKQLFAVAAKLGLPAAPRLEHVAFGVVRFGGKKTGTRTGNVVLLREVVEEAIDRIAAIIEEKNPDLPDKAEAARAIGVGALVFSDLSARRVKDVEFVWEDVVSFEGHTGPYVQYTHARCASILRRSGGAPESADLRLLTLEDEWETVKLLAQFEGRARAAARDAEPSYIAQYLLSLCETFSRYYNRGNEDPAAKVLASDPALAAARLRLVAGVRDVLARGLYLLGIEAPQEM